MTIDSGDTAFIIICTAMVMLMTPAVGGVVLWRHGPEEEYHLDDRSCLCGLCRGECAVGGRRLQSCLRPGYRRVHRQSGSRHARRGGRAGGGEGIPDMLFMVFQLVFAALALAIITSGVAERVKLSSFIVFGLLWTTLVYDPLAHWAWGGGGAGPPSSVPWISPEARWCTSVPGSGGRWRSVWCWGGCVRVSGSTGWSPITSR